MKKTIRLDIARSRIHSTAIIEAGVTIGERTSVWDTVHIRRGAVIGDDCIIGEKTYIAYDVRIGNRVKINALAYLCAQVVIEDGVMISAGVVFTNDRHPRATSSDLRTLRSSDPDENTLPTVVREGASIGANCTIGCNLEIGRFAMVGMGAVVTKSVPAFSLVFGNPARCVGCVCRCGVCLARFSDETLPGPAEFHCPECGLPYRLEGSLLTELAPPVHNV